MSANAKNAVRLFKKHLSRFITITAIVLVSVGFMSGIGEVNNKINISATEYYAETNTSDLNIKSKSPTGFTEDELNAFITKFGEENIVKSFSYEVDEKELTRYYYQPLINSKNDINTLNLLEGHFPKNSSEILTERSTEGITAYQIGDTVTINNTTFTVCGVVQSPLHLYHNKESSFTDTSKHLQRVVYADVSALPYPLTNELYVTLPQNEREQFDAFSNDYKDIIDGYKLELNSETVTVLSLYENIGFYSLVAYSNKVGDIGTIFVVFFLAITLLVVYSAISRLFDEERAQIACLKTLGYSNFKIISVFILFVFTATLLGGVLSLGVGFALTKILYNAFNMQYFMPKFPKTANFNYYLITFAITIFATTLLSFISGYSTVKNKPSVLLQKKSPKAGKKVLIERVPFIWNNLSFKYKATLRNVFLFKSRFFMTVLSIIGSTVLVLAGMGLRDCASKVGESADSILMISIALIVFSGLLCALVIYNITNINISERRREIATLMVLGYNDREVTGYIYREIYATSIIGAILGIPFGLLFLDFVFGLLNFGSITDIYWFTYILAPLASMFFAFLSTQLLRRKITKTDMNDSLKSLE